MNLLLVTSANALELGLMIEKMERGGLVLIISNNENLGPIKPNQSRQKINEEEVEKFMKKRNLLNEIIKLAQREPEPFPIILLAEEKKSYLNSNLNPKIKTNKSFSQKRKNYFSRKT